MDRWQQIDQILEAALEREPGQRSAFLEEACAGDEALRREAESLLAAHDRAGGFIESPPVDLAAEALAAAQPRLDAGQIIARYKILRELGHGGMGVVYLAEDPELGRQVALKLLPQSFAADEERVRRFRQEARAASALNHPNIITIHEIGRVEGFHFIITEFVDGKTLACRISQGPPPVGECLAIGAQLAGALSEAHSAGIVHRDIKPQNIMVNARGQVKVLDFGLVKVRREQAIAESEAQTESLVTAPGIIVGTMLYMSPEQVRGEYLDSRTDIFSFGVVMYELVSGRQPFAAHSSAEILSAILTSEPLPLRRYTDEIPAELERIVRKCLEKDRARRYQTAKEVATDLDNLQRDLENGRVAGLASEAAGAVNVPIIEGLAWWRSLLAPRVVLTLAAVMVTLVMALLVYWQIFRRARGALQPEIKSLAVLPLKSLDADENYLGAGIADAVIRRISQTGQLTVRPTSAVLRYLNQDTDALSAARQLNADAVLEGTIQRADDRLRVSVNLLRADGVSLWADSFDMRMSDIFTIQDTVAQQVATRLRLQLNSEQQARFNKRTTSNPVAYEYYVKGVYSFDQRSWNINAKPQMGGTIELFKKAIEVDPNYALAHAQLAYAYVWKVLLIDPTDATCIDRGKEEIERAQALDPQLAETHIARHLLLWSAYEGWQIEAAVRELLQAQQLNPNIGHDELGDLYYHIGLEDLGARELQRALDIDPTSEHVKNQIVDLNQAVNKYDEYLDAMQKFFPNLPISSTYFMGKGRLDEAQQEIEKFAAEEPNNPNLPLRKALLFALKGNFREAEALVTLILSKKVGTELSSHHVTYVIACVYALAGKSGEAVKWLKETAATGFPNYPLFARDSHLDRIRQEPQFAQFMARQKAQWEQFRQQFD